MRVEVSAKQLTMPDCCACCGGPRETTVSALATRTEGKRVIRVKTAAWSFPFCRRCEQHDEKWPSTSVLGVLVLTLLTLGLYLYFYSRGRSEAQALRTPTCSPIRTAITYVGWKGTTHSFDFASARFTQQFVTANSKKVVYTDSQVLGLLQSAPVPQPPPPPPPSTPSPPSTSAAKPAIGSHEYGAAWLDAAVPPSSPSSGASTGRRSAPSPSWASTPPQPSPSRPLRPDAPLYGARGSSLHFLGASESTAVFGRTLQAPMVYVASTITDADASAIVPLLPALRGPTVAELPYWPTYSDADPHQRGRYLDWLEGGRNDAAIPIGYVFLFFYGLERRWLVDRLDLADIRREIERLLSIYRANRSFRSYATNLLAFMVLPELETLDELTVHDRLAGVADDNNAALLGQLSWYASRKRPLPASVAVQAIKRMDGVKRGVAVERAYTELLELFSLRYREKYGDGLALQAAARPENLSYVAASPSLVGAARQLKIALPSPLGRPAQFKPLIAVWNQCVEDLKKVSFAKRNQGAGATLTAAAWEALPPELRAQQDHPDRDRWDELVGSASKVAAFHVVTAGQLAVLTGAKAAAKVRGVQLRKAVETAALLDYAVEPDARVLARMVPATTEFLIWPTSDASKPDPALWASVHTMLSLTMSVAMADGALGDLESKTVGSFIDELFALDETMRMRVAALRELLAREPSSVTAIAKKLQASHTPADLAKIGRVLVAVAGADGVVTKGEHKSLKALYKSLGLASAELAAAIAGSGARLESDRPVKVQDAEPHVGGEAIPPPPEENRGVRLNGDAIAAILAETREVAVMLASVLDTEDADDADDEAPAPKIAMVAPAPATPSGSEFAGLDARYQEILRQLLERERWPLAEVRSLATAHKLTPGAVLETINSWSDDALGDYVIEEAGDWRINIPLVRRPAS